MCDADMGLENPLDDDTPRFVDEAGSPAALGLTADSAGAFGEGG